MRKRKSSDAFGDTANNLGTAMDELMRHQPSLRIAAIKAIIGVCVIYHIGSIYDLIFTTHTYHVIGFSMKVLRY